MTTGSKPNLIIQWSHNGFVHLYDGNGQNLELSARRILLDLLEDKQYYKPSHPTSGQGWLTWDEKLANVSDEELSVLPDEIRESIKNNILRERSLRKDAFNDYEAKLEKYNSILRALSIEMPLYEQAAWALIKDRVDIKLIEAILPDLVSV